MPTETTADAHGRRPPRAVIHDLGYQRYDGPRLGRRRIVAALAWHSFRAAFGFGRGAKAKVVPVIVMIAICLPAVVNAFAMSGATRAWSTTTPTPRCCATGHDRLRRGRRPPSWSAATCAAGCCRCTSPARSDGRLPAGQVPRVHRRLPVPARGAAADPVRGRSPT